MEEDTMPPLQVRVEMTAEVQHGIHEFLRIETKRRSLMLEATALSKQKKELYGVLKPFLKQCADSKFPFGQEGECLRAYVDKDAKALTKKRIRFLVNLFCEQNNIMDGEQRALFVHSLTDWMWKGRVNVQTECVEHVVPQPNKRKRQKREPDPQPTTFF